VLAEIKRRSPSKGAINDGLDAPLRAREYVAGGAAALSILTEPTSFGGSNDDLIAVRAAVSVPLLRKDFHVAPVQLLEARALGAAAALLIARALSPDELPPLVRLAHEIGLEALVEVRDEHELERALAAGARIVGVNTRNLETLAVDAATAERLLPKIPAEVVAIHESGIAIRADVERASAAGADAVLVGAALSASSDPVAAVRDLCGVPRRGRG
jgi:indole-3-glycerol phosphate synthase